MEIFHVITKKSSFKIAGLVSLALVGGLVQARARVTTNVAGQCCSCNGATKKFVKSAWNATTYLCQ